MISPHCGYIVRTGFGLIACQYHEEWPLPASAFHVPVISEVHAYNYIMLLHIGHDRDRSLITLTKFHPFWTTTWHLLTFSRDPFVVLQVKYYEIVVKIFHISHNLTWYLAIVHRFTRIYPICSTYELTKQFR